MADTIRTRAELIALLPDNASGDISPQDLRDFLISLHLMADLDQVVTVAKAGGQYTTIQAGIDSIGDAASDKTYTVLVYPGEYDEAITLGNYIDIVAVNPENTKILQSILITECCICYLKINIAVTGIIEAITMDNEDANVKIDGDISSVNDKAIDCVAGTLTVCGNISSASGNAIRIGNVGILKVKDGTILSTADIDDAHGVRIVDGTLILQNVKIICTHADAKSIYASSAQDAYCMGVWANRDVHANITQKITNGFNFDADVQ